MTHTFAILGISKAAYEEIRALLKNAGYDHAFIEETGQKEVIDMHGIGIAVQSPELEYINDSILPEPKPLPKPATSSNIPEQRANKELGLEVTVLMAIATRVPFSFQAVAAFYNHYKSYDLLIAACDYAIKNRLTVLLLPPAEYI